jgi:hypothetical protein
MSEHAFCDGFITWAKENAECELRIAEYKIRNRVIAGLAARSRAARPGSAVSCEAEKRLPRVHSWQDSRLAK